MIENMIKRIEEKYSNYQIGETAKSQIRDMIRLEMEYITSQLDEAITIPIEIGDTVLGGKFKNKPIVVKSIDKNEKGDITINGKPLLKYRLMSEANAVSGGKVNKYITGKNLTLKGRKYSDIEFEVISIDNKSQLIKLKVLAPKDIFGQEMNVPFKTIRRGPFLKTDTSRLSETIKKVDGKYVVYPSKGGNRLGTHDTKEKALAQLKAIEVSKANSESVNELSDSAKYYRDNPEARKKKAETDKKINKRPEQVQKRVESNKKRSDAKKRGQDVKGKDYDHATNRFEKTATNRGRAGEGGRTKTNEELLSEIPMADLKQIDHFADKKMSPDDIVITDKHFFDRLNDPRNGKDISQAELVGFFKRLSKHKGEFIEFLKKYNSVITTDKRTDINIPFMRRANKQIVAKTIMRTKNFKSSDKRLEF